jgi:hypothetical protein
MKRIQFTVNLKKYWAKLPKRNKNLILEVSNSVWLTLRETENFLVTCEIASTCLILEGHMD